MTTNVPGLPSLLPSQSQGRGTEGEEVIRVREGRDPGRTKTRKIRTGSAGWAPTVRHVPKPREYDTPDVPVVRHLPPDPVRDDQILRPDTSHWGVRHRQSVPNATRYR